MKCVVTGGSGFIGSRIANLLVERGDQVTVLDVTMPPEFLIGRINFQVSDVRDWPLLVENLKGADEVYHCAGVLGTEELISRTRSSVEVNIIGGVNVLEAARLCQVPRVFFPTKPNDWRNTYSITKYAAEQFALMYHDIYRFDVTVMKWFNAYGPNQHHWPARKAVPTFIFAALTNRPLTVFGSGKQTVDMIYVDDVARIAVDAVRDRWYIGQVMDIGSAQAITVIDLAQQIIELAHSSSKIVFVPMREGEPEDSQICAKPTVLAAHGIVLSDFTEGLCETIAYYDRYTTRAEMNRVLTLFGIEAE